jgi:hypothetical protein
VNAVVSEAKAVVGEAVVVVKADKIAKVSPVRVGGDAELTQGRVLILHKRRGRSDKMCRFQFGRQYLPNRLCL